VIIDEIAADEIETYEAITGHDWVESQTMAERTHQLFIIRDGEDEEDIDEDDEARETRLKAEEEARLAAEQEVKAAKEAEEAVALEAEKKGKSKGKGKGKGKKKEEEEKEGEEEADELYVDLKEERKLLYVQLDIPIDPEDNQCVHEHVLFEHEIMCNFLMKLRDGVFQYLKTLQDDI